MNIIQTNNLGKSFGSTTAVEDLTLHVREGEIYGFLGLNGAGKTTTIRLLLGMIKAGSGSVELFGQPQKPSSASWNDIGYLVETPYSYPDLSVYENLRVMARLRGVKNTDTIDRVIESLHLGAYRNKKARHLSSGNNQRLGLAKALMHHPKLLILDEPVNGLDPAGIVEIRHFLKQLSLENGTTIFLSSHILSEIARLATRIGIVHDGRLVTEVNTDQLEQQLRRKLQVNTGDNSRAIDVLAKNGFEFNSGEKGLLECGQTAAISQPEKIAAILVQSGVPLKFLQVHEEDLESYFLRMTGSV